MLQQQGMANPLGVIPSIGNSPDHIQTIEKEISDLKTKLQVLFLYCHSWIILVFLNPSLICFN